MANPKLRFKSDNGNDYPEWKECILDDVFEERNEAHLITEDAPQLSFTIEQGVIYPEDKKTNKRDFLMKDKSSKKFLLTECDDIIYNPANLKFGAIHRNKLCRGVVSPIYAIFKTDQNPAFMEYVVRNPRFIKRSLKYLEGTVIKLMTLKPRDFVKMAVSIPCMEEQQRIADFLSNVDSLITICEQEVSKLQELKKGCLQKMFPRNGSLLPEIRFPGFTDAWEQRKFGDVGSVSMCKRIFKDETSDEGDIPFYKIGTFGGVPDAYISRELFEEYKSKFSYPDEGDILLSASGTIGRIVEYDGEEAYFQDSNIVWLKHDKSISNKFLKVLYPTVKWDGIEGSTIQRLYNDNFLKTRFMMPSLPEQEKLGDYFGQLDNLITLHQRECEKYKDLKKGLLQQMFV